MVMRVAGETKLDHEGLAREEEHKLTPAQVAARSKFLRDEADAALAKVYADLTSVLCANLPEGDRRAAREGAEQRANEIQEKLWNDLEPLAEELLEPSIDGKKKSGRKVSREYPWLSAYQQKTRGWQEHLLNGSEDRHHAGGNSVERREGVWRQRRTA